MNKFSIIITPDSTNPLRINFQGVYGEGLVPISYAWDFGDGNTSTSPLPVHTYSSSGIYQVTLAILTSEGLLFSSSLFSFQTTPLLSMPIFTVLKSKLGDYLFNLFQQNLALSVQKWQMYLQPQVPDLSFENTFVESAWPILWNYLIADLARLDLFMDETARMVLNQALNNTNSATEENSTGSIKRIETGPAQVEFYEDSNKQIDAVGQFIRYTFETGRGLVEQYKSMCCVTADRLNATLPFCPASKKNFLFIKSPSC
jgi:PKD repeat protein